MRALSFLMQCADSAVGQVFNLTGQIGNLSYDTAEERTMT